MEIQYKFTQNFGNFRDDLDKAVFEKGLEHEQSYGPKLPSTACRGPDPRRQEFSDSGGDNYGPNEKENILDIRKSTLFWIIMAVSFIGVPILILLIALKFKISSVVCHRFYDRRARCR